MKRVPILLGLIVVFFTVNVSYALVEPPQQNIERDITDSTMLTPEEMRNDIDFFFETVAKVHANMYAFVSREEMSKIREQLYQGAKTMYVMKNGVVIYEISVSDIDSIVFYKETGQNPLFPLNIGNSWTYENTTPYGSTQMQMKVLHSYTIDGITGFAFSEYLKGEPISLFESDRNGNFLEHLFNNDKFVHSTILYKNNVKKGDSWIYKSAVYTDDDFSECEIEERVITCITADTIITTPKGDFHCIGFAYHPGGKQDNGDPNHTMIDFLSENIGKIKSLHYEHENGKTWLFQEQILIDYFLKQ